MPVSIDGPRLVAGVFRELAKIVFEPVRAGARRDDIDRADGHAEVEQLVEPPVEEADRLEHRAHEARGDVRDLRPLPQGVEGEFGDLAPRVDIRPADGELPPARRKRVGARERAPQPRAPSTL